MGPRARAVWGARAAWAARAASGAARRDMARRVARSTDIPEEWIPLMDRVARQGAEAHMEEALEAFRLMDPHDASAALQVQERDGHLSIARDDARMLAHLGELARKSRFARASPRELEFADTHRFTFTLPLGTDWRALDETLFGGGARLLLAHRGVGMAHARGFYVGDKFDELYRRATAGVRHFCGLRGDKRLADNPLTAFCGARHTVLPESRLDLHRLTSALRLGFEHLALGPLALLTRASLFEPCYHNVLVVYREHTLSARAAANLSLRPASKVLDAIRRHVVDRAAPRLLGGGESLGLAAAHADAAPARDGVRAWAKAGPRSPLTAPQRYGATHGDGLPLHGPLNPHNLWIQLYERVPLSEINLLYPATTAYVRPMTALNYWVVLLAGASLVQPIMEQSLYSLPSIAAATGLGVYLVKVAYRYYFARSFSHYLIPSHLEQYQGHAAHEQRLLEMQRAASVLLEPPLRPRQAAPPARAGRLGHNSGPEEADARYFVTRYCASPCACVHGDPAQEAREGSDSRAAPWRRIVPAAQQCRGKSVAAVAASLARRYEGAALTFASEGVAVNPHRLDRFAGLTLASPGHEEVDADTRQYLGDVEEVLDDLVRSGVAEYAPRPEGGAAAAE